MFQCVIKAQDEKERSRRISPTRLPRQRWKTPYLYREIRELSESSYTASCWLILTLAGSHMLSCHDGWSLRFWRNRKIQVQIWGSCLLHPKGINWRNIHQDVMNCIGHHLEETSNKETPVWTPSSNLKFAKREKVSATWLPLENVRTCEWQQKIGWQTHLHSSTCRWLWISSEGPANSDVWQRWLEGTRRKKEN